MRKISFPGRVSRIETREWSSLLDGEGGRVVLVKCENQDGLASAWWKCHTGEAPEVGSQVRVTVEVVA